MMLRLYGALSWCFRNQVLVAAAIDWLVDVIERQSDAPPLEPGEIVTTGALTGAHSLDAGESWTTEITGGPSLVGPSLDLEK